MVGTYVFLFFKKLCVAALFRILGAMVAQTWACLKGVTYKQYTSTHTLYQPAVVVIAQTQSILPKLCEHNLQYNRIDILQRAKYCVI